MIFSDTLLSAFISAAVTISILLLKGLSKPLWERYFHTFKLESDYKFEQKKLIKAAISKHKVSLLNAAESLNHRLWNFSDNLTEGWHRRDQNEDLANKYYLISFCYRFLLFFAICRQIEKETTYLDSTVSTKNDLLFIKFIKIFPQLFCDVSMFKGFEYDKFSDKDHFFRDDFNSLLKKMDDNGKLLEFEQFKNLDLNIEFYKVIEYFSGVSITTNGFRWKTLNSFHFILMAFLNEYGYDFQFTNKEKINKLAVKSTSNDLYSNLKQIVERAGLNSNTQIKSIFKQLQQI